MNPPSESPVEPDAWAKACAEDLAAEKARRREQYGTPAGSAADEFKRLLDAVSEKVSGLGGPLAGTAAGLAAGAAGSAAQQLAREAIAQAKAVVEPVIERNPDFFDHLAAAGNELVAAYRAAVERQESSWTKGEEPPSDSEHIDLD